MERSFYRSRIGYIYNIFQICNSFLQKNEEKELQGLQEFRSCRRGISKFLRARMPGINGSDGFRHRQLSSGRIGRQSHLATATVKRTTIYNNVCHKVNDPPIPTSSLVLPSPDSSAVPGCGSGGSASTVNPRLGEGTLSPERISPTA